MKQIFLSLAVVAVLAATNQSCEKNGALNIGRQTVEVKIKNSESYSYDLGGFGDEEGASIARQAAYYQTSSLVRDTGSANIIYHYKPAANYAGTDEVELKSAKGSDGASPNDRITITTIKFTITN